MHWVDDIMYLVTLTLIRTLQRGRDRLYYLEQSALFD
jgi:hypothetical protein